MDDFPDFYCAGWALDRGANPYTYEPLHTCERRVNVGDTFRGQLFARNPWVAFPAPLPAYDFFPFMALGRALARRSTRHRCSRDRYVDRFDGSGTRGLGRSDST